MLESLFCKLTLRESFRLHLPHIRKKADQNKYWNKRSVIKNLRVEGNRFICEKSLWNVFHFYFTIYCYFFGLLFVLFMFCFLVLPSMFLLVSLFHSIPLYILIRRTFHSNFLLYSFIYSSLSLTLISHLLLSLSFFSFFFLSYLFLLSLLFFKLHSDSFSLNI